MTFLFPFFLAAGAAVIAPILLHLRRQPPKTRVEFSSLQFLLATPLVTTTRSRIERWILLLLRCLALLLLAAMFSRPFFARQETAQGQGRAVVILLDRSASMQQADHWKQALARVHDTLGKLTLQDQVAIATFDRTTKTLAGFAQLKQKSASERGSVLQPVTCGWASSDLGQALIDGVRLSLEAAGVAERRVVVVSDFQDGASVEALRGFAWPENVSLAAEPIVPKQTSNLSLSLVAGQAETDETTDTQKPGSAVLRVRLANARDSRSENFSLRWASGAVAAEGHLPAGTTRVLRLPRPEGDAPQVLQLGGDEWPFDNTLNIAPPQPRLARVVTLGEGGDDSSVDSPLFYLKRALAPTSKLTPQLTPWAGAESLKSAAWLVAAGHAEPKTAETINPWVEQGGRLLYVATDANPAFLKSLLGGDITLSEAEVKDYALISEVDHAHPALKPFMDARLRDFTKIHVWHHRTLKAGSLQPEVLARFDNGEPAWLSVKRGKGRIVILLSGWQPRDSQLALSSKFVPLLYGFLEEAGISLEQPAQYLVGDSLPGATADKPGFTKIQDGRTVAINVAPEESRVNPMDMTRLTSLGVKMQAGHAAVMTAADRERLANEEMESRQQYWLIALAVLLWVLGVETWLAGRKARSGTLEAA